MRHQIPNLLISTVLTIGSIGSIVYMLHNSTLDKKEEIKIHFDTQLKSAVFEILQTHCNSCHVEHNPEKVFTMDNMDSYAKKINRQVFIFKRMPKGKERRAKITTEEIELLKKWIDSIL